MHCKNDAFRDGSRMFGESVFTSALLSQDYFYVCHNGSSFFTKGTSQK